MSFCHSAARNAGSTGWDDGWTLPADGKAETRGRGAWLAEENAVRRAVKKMSSAATNREGLVRVYVRNDTLYRCHAKCGDTAIMVTTKIRRSYLTWSGV